ncbi:isoprenylcysteine carboxylmethyltransferase family protein [Fibrella sp. HMF5335]|uniref:Isoprenylcysteine carboxylmethyltransferase family protein n=1 Tax=Fibrella rubiginis TaxID=2817060 RepID=A0A939K2R0_9BACT|nr:isoprenylcysteine carboxylmethyltransferase family protein [Fibrella rubiginis]MBO0936579.1 isoprenylcysteine carboxylmethyltransferase family protein [Fibrella rubiginis]
MQTYVLLLLSWALFGIVHSVTATSWLKNSRFIAKLVSPAYYRLVYNALAILTFIPVWLALHEAPVQLIGHWHGLPLAGGFLVGLGVGVSCMALRQYDLAEFVGWPTSASTDTASLRRSGLLRYVRHPLYSGILLIAAGLVVAELSWRQALFGGCAFAYIRTGIYFEERKLVRLFGDQYLRFRQQVPMLIPSLRPAAATTN